jgi:hypothetical protein
MKHQRKRKRQNWGNKEEERRAAHIVMNGAKDVASLSGRP